MLTEQGERYDTLQIRPSVKRRFLSCVLEDYHSRELSAQGKYVRVLEHLVTDYCDKVEGYRASYDYSGDERNQPEDMVQVVTDRLLGKIAADVQDFAIELGKQRIKEDTPAEEWPLSVSLKALGIKVTYLECKVHELNERLDMLGKEDD